MRLIYFLSFFMGVAFPLGVGAQPHEIDVQSDTLNIDNTTGQAVFEGHVTVTHEALVLQADRVEVTYTKPKEGEKRQVETIHATGQVHIERDNREATAKEAIYKPLEETMTLFENVRVTEEEGNILTGTKMLYDLRGGRITMTAAQQRVRAQLGVKKN